MTPIDKATIKNSAIPHAVMDKVIPLLNEAVDRLEKVESRLEALEQSDDAPLESAFNKAIAKALGEAGYTSLAALKEVSDEELLAVKGISENRLETIRARAPEGA